MNNVRHVALLITLNLTPAQLSSRAESAASGGVEVAEEDRRRDLVDHSVRLKSKTYDIINKISQT